MSFVSGLKKIASGNLADDASVEAGLNRDMENFVPGQSLRDSTETGQAKQKNYRTSGVQNESKEFKKSLRKNVQTSRGGTHFGGTISEGF